MSSTELQLARLDMRELRVPFTVSFRHASAERTESCSVWVEAVAADGSVGHGEGCPRRYVTGETIESARTFLTAHHDSIVHDVTSLATLRRWIGTHASAIDANPAAWCAVELAVLDLLSLRFGCPVESVLGLPPLAGMFQYSAVLGDMDAEPFHKLTRRYFEQGFRDFKVKLSGDRRRDRAKLDVFDNWAPGTMRVRADANNVWPDAELALQGLKALEFPWFAVEEPIPPNQYDDLARIAEATGSRIVLDESLLRREQLSLLGGVSNASNPWIVNVRVSKMGGLRRTLDLMDEAVARGLGILVGAQVGETSLLTRAGLTAAHAAGASLVAQEGAFGTHLLARDVCEPALMFGPAGVLQTERFPWLQSPGLGPFTVPEASRS